MEFDCFNKFYESRQFDFGYKYLNYQFMTHCHLCLHVTQLSIQGQVVLSDLFMIAETINRNCWDFSGVFFWGGWHVHSHNQVMQT